MPKITKKAVREAENRFYRERQRWGENNLATVRAEIAWRDLKSAYEEQEEKRKGSENGSV